MIPKCNYNDRDIWIVALQAKGRKKIRTPTYNGGKNLTFTKT